MAQIDNDTSLSGVIRSRRLAAEVSQQHLAELAGCSIATVGLLERGYEPQHSEVVGRVLDTLDKLGAAREPEETAAA